MTRSLREIAAAVPGIITISGDAEITAPVAESSDEAQPGGVFVARRGLTTDGHAFIPDAIRRGVAAIAGEREMPDLPVPYLRVENAQEVVGYLAAAYHDFPSRKMTVVGVTGTDGKTTTSTLIHSILQVATAGLAGLISTVSAVIGDQQIDTGFHVTTPGAPQIQALLATMVENGLTHCVLEMTSHGLAQGRLNGVDLDLAVLTNVTHEHLDYHGSFEAYRAAKGRMFAMLSRTYRKTQPKTAVINLDDPSAGYFLSFPADRVVGYGTAADAEIRARDIRHEPAQTCFELIASQARGTVCMSLPGDYNVLNALAAIAATGEVIVDGRPVALREQIEGLRRVAVIPGRMERIDEGQEFVAIVDFAHTPNALKNALAAARTMVGAGGRLIAAFGSAGLRDREKRKLMAEAAVQLADFTIFTAEDPRTESLDDILQTMAEAAAAAGAVEGQDFIRVPDRGEALYRACQAARKGDVVIACGKGHEQSMAFGTVEHPWDDRKALRAALQGRPLRTLPTARRDETS